MATETKTKTRSWLSKLMRLAFVGLLAAAAVLAAGHFIWMYSGSNTWKLELERNGVKVYSLKSPGEVLKKYKIVRRVKAPLLRIAKVMGDTSLEHCTDWNKACVAAETIEGWKWTPEGLTSLTYYRLQLPSPFSPRDLVFKQTISQDRKTGVLTVDLITVTDKFRDDCCVHVTNIHNTWRWIPLPNGEVELDFTDILDPKLPYPMVNARAEQLYQLMDRVPELLTREPYQHHNLFDFVQEPAALPITSEGSGAPKQEGL